jgi:hypothetical protein
MPRVFGLSSILDDLKKMYNEWTDVYDLLVIEYNQLVTDAVNALMNKTFSNLQFSLQIKDYGRVGAPPYQPELNANGFIVFKSGRGIPWIDEDNGYGANLSIEKPKFLNDESDETFSEGIVQLNAHATLLAQRDIFLPEMEKELSVLKMSRVNISMNIEYQAEGMKTNVHYIIERIRSAKGQLKILLEILPMGSEKGKDTMLGIYEAPLDTPNVAIRLNAFLNPDGSLRDNWMFEGSINTIGDLTFGKP